MKTKLLFFIGLLSFAVSAQNYQYLGDYTSNGTPLYLENPGDIVSVETLEMISNSLPESYPVPDYNPHYISSGYDTDVQINQTADVWVTFVSEGAGYRNVLGYYTYDLNNPSATAPQPEDITIIFPNASALGSGGGLQVGDKVKIGTFSAGTGIGWVLLANAWNSSSSTVGSGLWQLFSNPDYNPEAQPELRYHNVLLNDPDNERVILGFEDIRRDYGSCDNDFNDAIFYVTANPYEAITTTNYADVSSAADVTSGNDGGLESNGNLADLIAKRNFKRTKTGDFHNERQLQTFYDKDQFLLSRNEDTPSVELYLPDTGMYGNEVAYISSPNDLLEITNATEIFSLDMYSEDTRVSAVLATMTEGSIYDHSKVICDRLNSSSLEDIRTVIVRGHQIISSKIVRATGELEYTLSFSVKLGETENELHSFWGIDQYPEGDYYNFQIWGSSFSQVFSIANHIIDTITLEKALVSTASTEAIPNVFVRSGYYSNGQLHLDLINKTGESNVTFDASIASTEVSGRFDINQSVALSGSYYDTVTVDTGLLFDVGFSLTSSSTSQIDALYLADGPWGVDFIDTEASADSFNVSNDPIEGEENTYVVERQPSVSGVVRTNVNLFRHVLPGDQTLDVTDYQAIIFDMYSDKDVELVLVTEELVDWNNRLRYTIPATSNETSYNISFNDFVNGQGASEAISNVKTIVFSVLGDNIVASPYAISVDNLKFGLYQRLSIEDEELELSVVNYPNPFQTETIIKLPTPANTVTLEVYDMLGRMVDQNILNISNHKVSYNGSGLSKGMYKYILKDDMDRQYSGSMIKK